MQHFWGKVGVPLSELLQRGCTDSGCPPCGECSGRASVAKVVSGSARFSKGLSGLLAEKHKPLLWLIFVCMCVCLSIVN